MARLVGVDLPRNKRMEVALTYIYGIGPTRAKKILAATGISPDLRTDDLTEEDIKKLRNEIAHYTIEGDLKREESLHIKRLGEISSYRGIRHRRKLPLTLFMFRVFANNGNSAFSFDTFALVANFLY